MDNESELSRGLRVQATRIEEDSSYSSQRHFNVGSALRAFHYTAGMTIAVLGGVGAYSLVVPGEVSATLGGLSALLAGAIALAFVFLNPGEAALIHYQAGNDYLCLRKDALYFLDVGIRDPGRGMEDKARSVEGLRNRAKELDRVHGNLYTPRWAYVRARRDIQEGRTSHREPLPTPAGSSASPSVKEGHG